jgi:putative Mn2+ efflux pump MntP
MMKSVASLAVSTYGAAGIVLLLVTHGSWYEWAKSLGLVTSANLVFEPTMLNCLLVSIPIGLAVFIVLLTSMLKNDTKQESTFYETLLPVISFSAMTVGGTVGSYLIPLAFNWVQFLGSVLLGGVTALAHAQSFQSAKLQEDVEKEFRENKQFNPLFSKWLALEHEFCQSALQWVTWGTIIFVTAGLIGYYLGPNSPAQLQPQLFETSVLHALIVGSWACIGVYLGIMAPIMRRMGFLRRKIKDIACADQSNKEPENRV